MIDNFNLEGVIKIMMKDRKRKVTIYLDSQTLSLLEMIRQDDESASMQIRRLLKRGMNETYNDIYEDYYN